VSTSDSLWKELRSAYGVAFDPRPALNKLASRVDEAAAWEELWQQLHHQGGVGDAAYAAVPELVRVHRKRAMADWNTYALVATIELARDSEGNPPVPDWLKADYVGALLELAELGAEEILAASDASLTRSILAILAIQKRARTYGRFLLEYGEDELLEMENFWNEPRSRDAT
jgi:hypothetical protein